MQDELQKALFSAYQEVLSTTDLSQFRSADTQLAGIFLPSAPAHPKSLMIVGQETRAWNGSFQKVYESPLGDYIENSMAKHRVFQEMPPGRSHFGRFHHHAARKADGLNLSIVWSNLFAVSYKRGSPTQSAALPHVAALSKALLLKQLEILRPQAIIFVTGAGYDKHIKSFFDGHISDSKVMTPRRLWRFRISGTPCFRTTHPRFIAGNQDRETALQMALEGSA